MVYSERGKLFTPHTSFRVRPSDRVLIDALMERLDASQVDVIRRALRCLAEREGIPIPPAERRARQRAQDAAGARERDGE